MTTLNDRREMAARVVARCRELAACTEVPGETTRTFLSEPMREVHRLVGRVDDGCRDGGDRRCDWECAWGRLGMREWLG